MVSRKMRTVDECISEAKSIIHNERLVMYKMPMFCTEAERFVYSMKPEKSQGDCARIRHHDTWIRRRREIMNFYIAETTTLLTLLEKDRDNLTSLIVNKECVETLKPCDVQHYMPDKEEEGWVHRRHKKKRPRSNGSPPALVIDESPPKTEVSQTMTT